MKYLYGEDSKGCFKVRDEFTIQGVLEEARQLARERLESVKFKLSGFLIIVDGNSNIAIIKARWLEASARDEGLKELKRKGIGP